MDLAQRYDRAGKRLFLLNLNQSCHGMLEKANVILEPAGENEPGYRVTTTELGDSSGGS